MVRHIINYLGSSFSSKLVVFFSTIVYSRVMSVEEFGVLNLYMSYIWIFVIIFSLNLYTSIGRYIYENYNDFNSFFSMDIILILLILTFFTCILFYNIEYFELLLRLPIDVIFILIVVVVAIILENIFIQIMIYNKQSGIVFKITFLKSIAVFVFSLVFMSFLINDRKYLSIIYADLLVSLFLIIFITLKLKKYFIFKYKINHIKYMLKYSIPLIPYMLSITLLSQSDRIMIDYFYGNNETGLYSMAYNLGIVLNVFLLAIMNAWNPTYFSSMNDGSYERVRSGLDGIYLISFFITLSIVLFGENVASILLSKEYQKSLHLISIVSISTLAYAIWQIWSTVIIYIKKTYLISLFVVVSTAINIFLNFLMLPVFGYESAVWTTLLSYIIMGLMCLLFNNYCVDYYKINILNKIYKVLILLIIYNIFDYFHLEFDILLKIFIFLFFIIIYRKKILVAKKDICGS